MSNAPHCPISRNGPLQGSRIQPPALDVAHVPTARDLPTVLTAINIMNNIVQHITNGAPQINNTGTPPVQQPPPPSYNRLTWKEVYRTYTENEVVNPEDHEQKIKIKVLSSVYFQEQTSGHQLAYGGP